MAGAKHHNQNHHGERADDSRSVDRFVGLSLGGGKSDRTAVTVIDYYKRQGKAFVIDVYETIGAHDDFSADEVLLDIIGELDQETKVLATDAPLTLPPCLKGCVKSCEGAMKCKQPVVRWMRNQYRKAKAQSPKLKAFTPYSQRPVDLYFRYANMDQEVFQDETMGANQAPKAARMQYLKGKMCGKGEIIEVWPKLTLHYMQRALHLTREKVTSYRHLEEGVHIRESILESISKYSNLFIYERDAKKIVTNITAFDSLICSWVAMLYGQGLCLKFKKDLPLESGWIQVPDL